jgi:hypothetical protein
MSWCVAFCWTVWLEPGARRDLVSHQFREIDRSPPITLPGNLAGWLDGNDWTQFNRRLNMETTAEGGSLRPGFAGILNDYQTSVSQGLRR